MLTQNRIVKIHPNILLITINGKKLYLPIIKRHKLLYLKHRDTFFNLKERPRNDGHKQLLTKTKVR